MLISAVSSPTGIHGVPFEPWGGVQPTPGNENSGYCHHEDILFPTWHRAYVALYEVCRLNLSSSGPAWPTTLYTVYRHR